MLISENLTINKKTENKPLSLWWAFKFIKHDQKDYKVYLSGAYYSADNKIIINVNVNRAATRQDLINRIEEINWILLHEVKHFLDADVDGLFNFKSAKISKVLVKNIKDPKTYVNSDVERQNFLISVIKDLELIRKNNPSVSFHQALQQSGNWLRMKTNLVPNKLNKFKSKVATWWNQYNPNQQ